jgi:hypothetical protein
MNKALVLVLLSVILAAQCVFIFSVKSVNNKVVNAFGTSAVIVSKAPYMSARAFIQVYPDQFYNENVTLIFPNGSQREVNKSWEIEVFLPRSNKSIGTGLLTPGEGVNVSNSHPLSAAVVANVTAKFFTYGIYGSDAQSSDNVDIYWFKIQGYAHVYISEIGVGI